ncbi:uncharacterized protein C7orf31 homolog [Spea bombifrons]|uniref:uncharacterized protein C7orf31 homolog n=1 Tax=Spea bombifrons TaxID=233779 RepID=UPI002349ED2C|nr:uncharacterized protein C7orf31 homolog [Spea bombifrons]
MEVQFDLSHYYRQREGALELSPSLQSSEVWTPLQLPQRITVSPDRYQEYLARSPFTPRLPWGKEREYGGIGPVSLPDDHRPKAEPPPLDAKGHKHYGYGGDPWPRGLPIQQFNEITQLKKSAVRASDDLYPKPPAASISARQLYVDFPAEHPYHSHISKFAMFPSFKSPEESLHCASPPEPERPSRPYTAVILKKTKGNPYRHEVIYMPPDSEKEPLIWPGQQGYFHFPKFHLKNGQIYYPMPPKTVAPNASEKPPEERLSDRTANMQKNVIKSQWITSYNRSFTGRGEMNPLKLDNYYEKLHSRIVGQSDENTELKQAFLSAMLSARPLKDHIAEMKEGHRIFGGKEVVQKVDAEDENSKSTKPNLYEESGTGQFIRSVWPPRNDCHISEVPSNSKDCTTQQEPKCYSPHRMLTSFGKITDTDKHNALYRRQVTPMQLVTEEELKAPKSLCYRPLTSRKLIGGSETGIEDSTVLKANESQNALNSCNKQRVSGIPAPGEISSKDLKRPHTAFSELPEVISKSEMSKNFHQNFPEKAKDLRDNYHSGKKHTFYGFHSFYFHN